MFIPTYNQADDPSRQTPSLPRPPCPWPEIPHSQCSGLLTLNVSYPVFHSLLNWVKWITTLVLPDDLKEIVTYIKGATVKKQLLCLKKL